MSHLILKKIRQIYYFSYFMSVAATILMMIPAQALFTVEELIDKYGANPEDCIKDPEIKKNCALYHAQMAGFSEMHDKMVLVSQVEAETFLFRSNRTKKKCDVAKYSSIGALGSIGILYFANKLEVYNSLLASFFAGCICALAFDIAKKESVISEQKARRFQYLLERQKKIAAIMIALK